MRVLVLKNGKLQEKEIKNSLEELQSIVGGYIKFPFLGNKFRDNTIDVIINEEGKFIEGLKPEIAMVDRETKSILDIVYGNCIFASHDEEGNTIGLNDEQIKIIMEELQMNVLLSYKNNEKEFVAKALFL